MKNPPSQKTASKLEARLPRRQVILGETDPNAWLTAFKARDDLREFGDSAIGLFALALHFPIDDIVTVGSNAITDGSNDKKCDLIFTDTEEEYAVISQCHFSKKSNSEAPSNKASDLNTAIGWILTRDIEDLPERLASPAQELREAIRQGQVSNIHVWYVHNLPESENVKSELKTVEQTATSAIENLTEAKRPKIFVAEVGANTLQEWYHDTQSPILVTDQIEIPISDGFEIKDDDWSSFVTSIPARFLHNQWKKHKTRLFSANLRDYLGSRKSDSNINHGIKRSLRESPSQFWAFNNGITIIVNDYRVEAKNSARSLVVNGMSIVNGAQTTGAIGTESYAPRRSAQIQARFIKTKNNEMIRKIVQFNNSQNRVTASDFRSYDSVQRRLKEEFDKIGGVEYEGGRRGGADDMIKRRPNLLPPYTVGQALAAFHADPVIAYNQKSDIWAKDSLYSKYFCDQTTAGHILLTFSLIKCIDRTKVNLIGKSKTDESLTAAERDLLSFLRIRGANYLLASAIADCMETIIGKKIANSFQIKFNSSFSLKDAEKAWEPLVNALLPLSTVLKPALNGGLKSVEKSREVIKTFHSLVQTAKIYHVRTFSAFVKRVQLG